VTVNPSQQTVRPCDWSWVYLELVSNQRLCPRRYSNCALWGWPPEYQRAACPNTTSLPDITTYDNYILWCHTLMSVEVLNIDKKPGCWW